MSTVSTIPSPQTLSSSLSFSFSLGRVLAAPTRLFLHHSVDSKPSQQLTIHHKNSTMIRMGGGPRTYPGGVSKWQWKRMQARKAKQLLKARLARERHIYEMRKRAELKAAVSELEKPWEAAGPVDLAPTLFSVTADQQLKVLADRFQKPGGFDLWSPRDGPQLFHNPPDHSAASPSSSPRFFPKGIVPIPRPHHRQLSPLPLPRCADVVSSESAEAPIIEGNKSCYQPKFRNKFLPLRRADVVPETPSQKKKNSPLKFGNKFGSQLQIGSGSEQRRGRSGVDRWIRHDNIPPGNIKGSV